MDSNRESSPGTPPKALLATVRRILGPLVRLFIARQVTFPQLAELLKQVYVAEAEREFALDEKKQSASRIHLLTGVHRKDVRRLRGAAVTDEAPPKTVSLAGQIIARWTADPRFVDEKKRPIPLPRQSDKEPCFEELVQAVCKQDVRTRAVLEELVRLRVVDVVGGEVRLLMEAFVPEKGLEEKIYYLGRNVADHIAAAANNVQGGEPPFPERSVYYGGLSDDAVAELKDMGTESGMEVLQRVNRRALELKKSTKGKGRRRMNFGLYFFSEPVQDREEDGHGA